MKSSRYAKKLSLLLVKALLVEARDPHIRLIFHDIVLSQLR